LAGSTLRPDTLKQTDLSALSIKPLAIFLRIRGLFGVNDIALA
jgi:hypothetical protein